MKIFNTTLFLLITLIFSTNLQAQFAEQVRTGRPGQSIGAYTLGKQVLQLQAGTTFTSIKDNGILSDENRSDYNIILRMGLLEKLEISGVFNYRHQEFSGGFINPTISGVSNTQIGLRYNILEAKDYIPAIGIQGRLLLKAQSDEYQRQNIGSKFIVVIGQKVTDWLSFTGNYIMTWEGNDQDATKNYTGAFSFPITKRLGGFVEIYGNLDDFTANYDGGLGFFVNDNLKLDASAGWQGQDGVKNWFVDAGFSWRLVWR